MDVEELEQSVSEDKDVVCLFCDARFSEDHKGEFWFRCIMCNLWANEQYSVAEKDDYVCHFCRKILLNLSLSTSLIFDKNISYFLLTCV